LSYNLQAVVGNLRASRNLKSILYHVVVVTGERDMSRAGGLTEKKHFCLYISSLL